MLHICQSKPTEDKNVFSITVFCDNWKERYLDVQLSKDASTGKWFLRVPYCMVKPLSAKSRKQAYGELVRHITDNQKTFGKLSTTQATFRKASYRLNWLGGE